MRHNQNDFKISKSIIGKLLAIFSVILSVFSLILFCTAYLNSKLLSDSTKTLQTVAICFVIATSVIFAVYYLLFRQRKGFEFIVSIGLIFLSAVHLMDIITIFVTLSEKISTTSRHVDVSPMIADAIATAVIPILSIILFFFSAYFIFKKKPGKLLTLMIIPTVITVLSYIPVPTISAIANVNTSAPDGSGTFLELFALCQLSIYSMLCVLGLDLGSEYKSKLEASEEKKESSETDSTIEKSDTPISETDEQEICNK